MQKIEAIYGCDNQMVNVTESVLNKLVKNNKVVIPAKCNFTSYFGDICPDKIKYLILTINDYKFVLKERTIENQIIFDLNNNYNNKDKKITVVYYAFINPLADWESKIAGQLNQLCNTGILETAELFIHVTSNQIYHDHVKRIIYTIIPHATVFVSTVNNYEYEGIHLVWKLVQQKPNNIFLYFHSKGMSYNTFTRHIDEKILFEKVIVDWRKIVSIFEQHPQINKIGLAIAQDGGFCWWNFWWCRGRYLLDCEEPILTTNRWYYESWLREKLPGKRPTTNELRNSNYIHNDCYSLFDDKIGVTCDSSGAVVKMNNLISLHN